MARFALFSPTGHDPVQPAQIVLVREHFSIWGFFLPLPYCLWHRNWRFSGLLVLLGTLIGLLPAAGLPDSEAILLGLELLTGLYVGLAAADIRTAALERGGYRMIDVAIAPDEDSALLRYLDQHWAAARQAQASAATPTQPAPTQPPPHPLMAVPVSSGPATVLGLFPEAQR